MLQDSSKPAEGGKTGDPKARVKKKKVLTKAQLEKKRDYAREYYRRVHSVKAKNMRGKQGPSAGQFALARRVDRLIRDYVQETGDLNDMVIAAHQLAKSVLQ